MNWASIFLKRPVASTLLAVAMLLLGALGYWRLPVAALPQVDIPTIVVRASLPGASPESMSATVATPLERAMLGVSGVKAINSSSSQGSTQVVLHFALDTDIHVAAREVQAAINVAVPQLPAAMPSPPQAFKVNPSQSPIFYLALSSQQRSAGELYHLATKHIQPNLAQVSGVGAVELDGASMPAVRIVVNPNELLARGISLEQVRLAVSRSHGIEPLGIVEQGQLRWQLALSNELEKAADFADLIIVHQAQGVVRLKDVAEVHDAVENRYVSGFHNGKPAVLIKINRQPNANTVKTIDQIKAQLPEVQQHLPADTQLTIVMDGAELIHKSLVDAGFSLLYSMLLVLLVVTLMLGRLKMALVPSLIMIITLIASCGLMYLAGFSLNNLSIMALVLGLALVIDDAIVVLENIQRYRERGYRPFVAAQLGIREVGASLISMNLVLVLIFVTVLFMGGVIERLFREFSISLIFIVLLSLLLSFILTPALAMRSLDKNDVVASNTVEKKSRWTVLAGLGQRILQLLNQLYLASLVWLFRHAYVVFLLWGASIAASVYLYQTLPKEVLPEQDSGRIEGFIRGDDGFSFQLMQPKIATFTAEVLKDPVVADIVGLSGASIGNSNAFFMLKLKPKAEREGLTTQQIVERIKKNASWQAGAVFSARVEQDLRLNNPFGNADAQAFTLLLQSDDVGLLKTWAPRVSEAMKKRIELEDVESIGDEGIQHVQLQIDREAAKRLGVDLQAVASVLNNAFAQRQISTIYQETGQFQVVMEVDRRFSEHPETLAQVKIPNQNGEHIALTDFATWNYATSSDRVYRRNQYAATGIGYVVKSDFTPAEADTAIRETLAELMLPNSIFVSTDQDTQAQSLQSNISTAMLLLVVLIMIYILLGVSYESVLHPLTILSAIPAVAFGALLALWLFNLSLSLIALLGLFLLMGIVVKNAILMVDFALREQRQGKSAIAAAMAAAKQRFRPIMMTNTAAILAAVPLALSQGEGSELRQPLGLVIVFGMLFGLCLTLYLTPLIYVCLDRMGQYLKHWLIRFKPQRGKSI